jgi:hypothetical protein
VQLFCVSRYSRPEPEDRFAQEASFASLDDDLLAVGADGRHDGDNVPIEG